MSCLNTGFCSLWIPEFPAWALAWADPSLAEKVLLVHDRGRVVAASTTARAAGEGAGLVTGRAGWPLERAEALLPGATLRPLQGSVVAAAWEAVQEELWALAARVEPLGPGLALLHPARVSDLFPLLARWRAWGGAAPDRTTSLLAAWQASRQAPRERLLGVPPGGSRDFLRTVPVDVLREAGLSADTLERLHWFGWHTVGHLGAVRREQLVAQFPEGEMLHRFAAAADTRPALLYLPPVTVEACWKWDEEPAREPAEWQPVLELLTGRAAAQLEGRRAGVITVVVHGKEGTVSRGRRFPHQPLTGGRELLIVARLALQDVLPPRTAVTCLEVRLGSLSPVPSTQGRLWGRARPPVEGALRAVETRYPGALRRYVPHNPAGPLPEEAYHLEPASRGAASGGETSGGEAL